MEQCPYSWNEIVAWGQGVAELPYRPSPIRILFTTASGNAAAADFTTEEGAGLFTEWLTDEGLGWERIEG